MRTEAEEFMFKQLLLVASALALSTTVTNAQRLTDANELACKVAPDAALITLEGRRQILEKEIGRKSETKPGKSNARTKEQEQSLRKSQEELLDVLFQIDCLKVQRAPENRRLVLGPKPQGVIEVTTYYATNRKQNATAEPAKIYGGEVGKHPAIRPRRRQHPADAHPGPIRDADALEAGAQCGRPVSTSS